MHGGLLEDRCCRGTAHAAATVFAPAQYTSGTGSASAGFSHQNEFKPTVKAHPMIKLAFVFLIIALIAGLLGLTGIAGVAVDIAMFLFIAALVIFAALLILGLTVFKKVTS
jgi:uncharacterized membrane protein YtjA (UPF0391 family)